MDSNDLVGLIKKAATEAVHAGKPADLLYGTVLSAEPLQISVDQKIVLGMAQLVLTRNVTDYTQSILTEWQTESADGHTHSITGEKTVTVKNALSAGERVILMQAAGGQRYVVLDRVC